MTWPPPERRYRFTVRVNIVDEAVVVPVGVGIPQECSFAYELVAPVRVADP